MNQPLDEQRNALLTKVRDGLKRGETRVGRLRTKNSRFIIGSIVFGALSTVLAGVTAAAGPIAGAGPPAWRWTCGIVAVLTATATVLSTLHRQLSITENLARATACVGKLSALEFALTVSGRGTDDCAHEYETVITTYHDVIV